MSYERTVRIKRCNIAKVSQRLHGAGVSFRVLDEDAGVHARTSEEMVRVVVGCSGRAFHRLIADVADTRDYRD